MQWGHEDRTLALWTAAATDAAQGPRASLDVARLLVILGNVTAALDMLTHAGDSPACSHADVGGRVDWWRALALHALGRHGEARLAPEGLLADDTGRLDAAPPPAGGAGGHGSGHTDAEVLSDWIS